MLFDSLEVVPEELADPLDFVDLAEGRLYVVVWPREGYVAKVFVEQVVVSEQKEYAGYILYIIFRWAYQDDGSRNLRTVPDVKTALELASWAA